jgi:hypothetical protein
VTSFGLSGLILYLFVFIFQDRSMDDKDPSSCDNDKRQADASAMAASAEVEGGAERNTENPSSVPSFRLRSPLSPRADNIRMRMKFRPRHSSGSDDSINLSQTGNDSRRTQKTSKACEFIWFFLHQSTRPTMTDDDYFWQKRRRMSAT